MSQTVIKRARPLKSQLLRLAGPILLVGLLLRLDLDQARATLQDTKLTLVVVAATGVFPLIFIKTLRWRNLMRAQNVHVPVRESYLVYFSSLFIGFLTPGRLGEFVKAIYVERSCNIPLSRAFSSVLADRLFDFYALLFIGNIALVDFLPSAQNFTLTLAILVSLTVPLVFLMHDPSFALIQRIGLMFGRIGRKLFDAQDGVLPSVRNELRRLSFAELVRASLLTVIAYTLFYAQGFLLARALGITLDFVHVMFAVALGSLVTLIPISISGLGTRELAIITYMESFDVQPAHALGFSLLIFFVFQVAGGTIGALAWWLYPIPIQTPNTLSESN